MEYTLLNRVNSPQDVKKLSLKQCDELAVEMRHYLVNSVAKTGGHLASNLGTVELSIAMHRVFNSPSDKLIFDVGHQCYAHKILTGRREMFDTLRKKGGISGFPKIRESEHDAFIAGHSSISISAALGIAKGFALKNQPNYAVAVIGDGSFTGGQVYEALNNAGRSKTRLVIILNHNDMSISKNVGGFARYLTRLRSKPAYLKLKSTVEGVLDKTPVVGSPIKGWLSNSKTLLKTVIYRSTFFEEIGFSYLGPVDGHNMRELTEALSRAKDIAEPVIVQVKTTKGKGYSFAEQNPGAYHATSAFNPQLGDVSLAATNTYSDTMGRHLTALADKNNKIVAITAAMKYGTGLNYFYQAHKSRFFDVGIAEQHAVTFATGLASEGFIPVFAVYSSFLQRGFDQVLHDASIDRQHIVLAIDRAGIVGEDGETHQGLFDTAYLTQIPEMILYSPEGYEETRLCLSKAVNEDNGVVGVRYPRGADTRKHTFAPTTSFTHVNNGSKTIIVSYGRVFSNCFSATENLKDKDIVTDMLKLTQIAPIQVVVIKLLSEYDTIVFVEEGIKTGGIGMQIGSALLEYGFKGKFVLRAVDNQFVMQSSVNEALHELMMDTDAIATLVCESLSRN